MKRSLAVLLVLVTALVLAPGAIAKTTITVWSWSDGIGQSILDTAKEFNAEHKDIQVNVELHPFDSYFDKIRMAQAGNVAPELVRGGHLDLSDPFPNDFYKPNLTDWMKAQKIGVFKDILQDTTMTRDGQIYAIPWTLWTTEMFYNKDLFAAAGLSDAHVPKTWDELLQVTKKLTKHNSDDTITQAGLVFEAGAFTEVFLPQVMPNFYRTGDRKVKFVGTEAEKAYSYVAELVERNLVPWPGNLWEMFPNQTAAMTFVGSWYVQQAPNWKFNWGAAVPPKPSPNAASGKVQVATDWRFSKGLSETTRQAAAEFLRYLLSEGPSVRLAVNTGLLPSQLEYYRNRDMRNNPVLLTAGEMVGNAFYAIDGAVSNSVVSTINGVVAEGLNRHLAPSQVIANMENAVNNMLDEYYKK